MTPTPNPKDNPRVGGSQTPTHDPLEEVDSILDEFYWETVNRPVKGIDEGNTDELDVIMTHKRQLTETATQAIQALIDQQTKAARMDEILYWFDPEFVVGGSKDMSISHTMNKVKERLDQLRSSVDE